jgi:hypothetical protein
MWCPLMVTGFAWHDIVCVAASRGLSPSLGAMAVLKRHRPERMICAHPIR